MGSHLTATGRHLPYGITRCYLLPDTSERAPPRQYSQFSHRVGILSQVLINY